ncbi:MAG: hypothetical protein MJK12_07845 [Colwellia sp.]|nr:hypothetical protein [Colwellia sp.]
MRSFYILLTVLLASQLISCSSTQTVSDDVISNVEHLYFDDLFPSYKDTLIESEHDIFSIDDEMRLSVRNKIKAGKDIKEQATKLVDLIFSNGNINLDYVSGADLTAKQTYHSGTANCLSLTIMAYALATEANLDVKFQSIKIPEYWVRNKNYNMLTGHVNLLVSQKANRGSKFLFAQNTTQVDFDPFISKKHFSKEVIDKRRVLALFYNNKGAQALVDIDYNKAYAYFKAAAKADPSHSYTWGNLGVLYRLSGKVSHAKLAYQHAVKLNKKNFTSSTNLAIIYKMEGELEKAKRIEKILLTQRMDNPHYHALLADEAFYNHNLELAVRYYKKAIKLNKHVHEFYFQLAKVYFQSGQMVLARKTIEKAISKNKAPETENRYIAKLNYINSVESIN